MKNSVELLAPVGGIEHFFAAVENGADAVYLGGHQFNARIKADNFTIPQLIEAIKYAHLRNVKVYITVNTLLSDKEFPLATEYCTELYNMGADGIIVQDLGLAGWVNANLPDLNLHLSTQGTVYNLSGVNAAKSLGFSRVVLARETTLEEIKTITSSSDMEIEIFVHGALCMCYSGQCQMSRVIGGVNGRSANKGLCAQPCRLPYRSESKSGRCKNEAEPYPLSPKDLCSIDSLGEIIDAGVKSLKIEGRMKSPEYVAIVTGIYRKYIDEYLATGMYCVSVEDREALRQIYSRGEFTSGYLFGNPKEDLLTEDLPKHQGIYIGKVAGVLKGNLIDVKLSESLSLGDGIEIRNEQLTGNVVTYLEKISNDVLRIGDIKGYVEKGQSVYRITQSALLNEARKSYEGAAFEGGKCYKRVPIDLKLSIAIGKHPTIEICEKSEISEGLNIGKEVDCNNDNELDCNNASFIFTDETVVAEVAINKPLEKSIAERQLRKTGSTCYDVQNVSVEIEDGSTLPLSAINKLRRDAIDAYSNKKLEKAAREIEQNFAAVGVGDQRDSAEHRRTVALDNVVVENTGRNLAFYFFDAKLISSYDFKSQMDFLGVKSAKVYLPLQDFMKGNTQDSIQGDTHDSAQAYELPDYLNPIPYISNISKGKLDEFIDKNFEQILRSVKQTGIAIGNLGWCREFLAEGVTVYSDYGLNLYNEAAQKAAYAFGVRPVTMSLEIHDEGEWPIMITEHPMNFKRITDRKNQPYNIIKTAAGDKWMLFKTNKRLSDKSLKERWSKATGEFRIYIAEES